MKLTPEDMERLLYTGWKSYQPQASVTEGTTQEPKPVHHTPGNRRKHIAKTHQEPGNTADTMSAKQLTNFWRRVDRSGGDDACWKWQGSLTTWGYGHFRLGRRHAGAHRLAYELIRGTIPDGLVIDHLCRNRQCCNPWHMEIVTNRENLLRGNGFSGRNVRKVQCPKGHPYDLVIKGRRYCSVCLKEAQRRGWQKANRRRAEEYKHIPLMSRHKP